MNGNATGKGQVKLPKGVRDDKLRVAADKYPVTQLKGMLPRPAVPLTLQEMDEAVSEAATRKD